MILPVSAPARKKTITFPIYSSISQTVCMDSFDTRTGHILSARTRDAATQDNTPLISKMPSATMKLIYALQRERATWMTLA